MVLDASPWPPEPSLEVDDVPWREFVEPNCSEDRKDVDVDVRLAVALPLGGHDAPRALARDHSRKNPRAVTNRPTTGVASQWKRDARLPVGNQRR